MNRSLAAVSAFALISVGAPDCALSQSPQPPLSPSVRAAIAKPMDALDKALAADAAAPPPSSDRERLERMGKIDQSWRYYMGELKLDGLTPDEVKAAYAAVAARTEPIDSANLEAVMAMRPKEGWFSKSAYGEVAVEAAFNIVEHGDTGAQERVLPFLAAGVAAGEVNGWQYANMFDRVQVARSRPQRYGTQFRCVEHRVVPYPLENEANVETLRAPMGFPITFAEQAKGLAERAHC